MSRTKSKGHGCLGFTLTLIIVLVVIFALLLFTTNVLDGVKNQIYSFFYPQKYAEQVEKYSSEFGVDEALIYAVIYTESGFREEVESSAGAIGLMQLMPSTFEWLQGHLAGDLLYTTDDLKNPDINIRYGTYLISYLLDRYSGDTGTALAAYNAGVANVDNWLEDSSYSADGVTLSTIPYSETDRYVKRIEDAYDIYRAVYYSKSY